jgi:photosystem II stability/assembly factor-like uncharacterized protein
MRLFRRGMVLSGFLLVLLVVGWPSARSHWLVEDSQERVTAQSKPVLGIAVDGGDGTLLKAHGGLFRSTDQGVSWHPFPIPVSLHPDRIGQVATTAADPARLYAAGPGAGITRSDDHGRTWRSIGGGLPSQEVGAVAVHSFRPDTVYAWVLRRGIFRTEDGGGRWQKMDDGPPVPVVALAHSPLEGSMNTGWLYAATPEGPYLSMDCF